MSHLNIFLLSIFIGLSDCAVVLQCGEVCLQDIAQYTCTIDGDVLSWILPDTILLQVLIQQPNVTDSTKTFTAVLTNHSSNQLTSTLSFMATIQLNNEEIMCSGGGTASCNIKISGTPSVPLNASVTAIGPNTVVVSWSPPLNSSQCIDHYVVSIVNGNIVSNMNTSNSSTTFVINQLIQGMNYSFSVRGVDRAERTGEESEIARITLDVPESVIDLNFTLTDESLNFIELRITWKAPSVTLRPPVIDYHVYHNITSSDGSLVHNVTNNMTHITFTSVSRGRQYIVNVTAENIIGIGEESLMTVSIPVLLSTSTSNVITQLSVESTIVQTVLEVSSESALNSYFNLECMNSFATTQKIPPMITSNTCNCISCTSSDISTKVVVAIAVPVTMIISSVISVLITSLIFCLVIKKRNTYLKPQEKASKDTPLVIYDLPNVCDDTRDVKKNIELQANSAYGQL